MNTDNKQQGFAALEAFLLLIVLAVIGFSGWFVYHSKQATEQALNVSNSSNPISTSTTGSSSAAQKLVGKVDTELTFSYPSDWHLVQTPKETYRSADPSNKAYAGETTQVTKISSPSQNTTVTIEGGIGGVGGACVPEEEGTFTALEKTTLPNDPANIFAAYRQSDGYVTFAAVNAQAAQKATVGASGCTLAFATLLDNYHRGIGRVSITYKPFLVVADGVYKASPADFSAYQASAEYKSALDIVKSIRQ